MSVDKFVVTVAAAASRDLSSPKVPRKVADAVLMFASGPLAESPARVGKPLVGTLSGVWSARRADFRILYEINFDRRTVRIIAVSHRSDAYGHH
jgi:mRNA-degrading endonuclease RelE of RelBE toxin-antitoxin system